MDKIEKSANDYKIKELISKIDEYKIGSKKMQFGDYIFEDMVNETGFMVFLNKKYNQKIKSEKEICDKLGNCTYTDRYYYYQKLPKEAGEAGERKIIFILFNPSKACPEYADDTINNCYKLVKDDYNAMEVLNVFSCRNPEVDKEFLLNNFETSRNMDFITEFFAQRQGYDVVLGWGYGKEKDYKDILQKIRDAIENLNQYSIGIDIKSQKLLNHLNSRQCHPGNQAWSAYGGFDGVAKIKKINAEK